MSHMKLALVVVAVSLTGCVDQPSDNTGGQCPSRCIQPIDVHTPVSDCGPPPAAPVIHPNASPDGVSISAAEWQAHDAWTGAIRRWELCVIDR